MNKMNVLKYLKYWLLIFISFFYLNAIGQQVLAFPKSQIKYKTLIVEAVYPIGISEYEPPVIMPMNISRSTKRSPEQTIFELVASMQKSDFDWNSSLWSSDSRELMKIQDIKSNQDKKYWENLWKNIKRKNFRLISEIKYGKYILIEMDFEDENGRKRSDTFALESENDNWFVTQKLSADPILFNWRNISGRTQIVPATLLDK